MCLPPINKGPCVRGAAALTPMVSHALPWTAVKSVGGKGGPDCPERMEAAQTFDHQMASTFSLAFLGPWRQKEQFQAVFFFF